MNRYGKMENYEAYHMMHSTAWGAGQGDVAGAVLAEFARSAGLAGNRNSQAAARLLPAVLCVLEDRDARGAALATLREWCDRYEGVAERIEDHAEAVLEACKEGDANAAAVAAALGPEAVASPRAVEILLGLVDDEAADVEARSAAATALARVDAGENAVPAFLKAMRRAALAAPAARALRGLVERGYDVDVPELVALLDNPAIAAEVLETLATIGPRAAPESSRAVLRLLDSHTPRGLEGSFPERDAVAAAAARAVASFCEDEGVKDSIGEGVAVVATAVVERTRHLAHRKLRATPEALAAAVRALNVSISRHDRNRDYATSALPALVQLAALLPDSDDALEALLAIVDGKPKLLSQLRDLGADDILRRIDTAPANALLDALGRRCRKPALTPPIPRPARAWEETKGAAPRPILTPRQPPATRYSPYNRTSLW